MATDSARSGPARPSATGAGIVILPDVRGLHPFYEELALRFAENGVDAIAIDYFGRTAGTSAARRRVRVHAARQPDDAGPGLPADIRRGAEHLRPATSAGSRRCSAIGFCFGGRLAFLSATLGLDLAGSIGFYGCRPDPAGATSRPRSTSSRR